MISLYSTGAAKMAQLMVAPQLEDLFEIIATRGSSFELAEIQVDEDTPFVDQQLPSTGLRERGIMVVGVRQVDGQLLIPPPDDHRVLVGEQLIAIGSTDAIQQLAQ